MHRACACAFLPSLLVAGVRGTITRFVTTIPSASSTYHFYELDVQGLDADWLESKERRREWVDYAEASRRLAWKAELAQGLSAGLSSLQSISALPPAVQAAVKDAFRNGTRWSFISLVPWAGLAFLATLFLSNIRDTDREARERAERGGGASDGNATAGTLIADPEKEAGGIGKAEAGVTASLGEVPR